MRTLMIVDDEMLIADGLRGMLAEAFRDRLNVVCCYSAATAMETAAKEPVDILLTDINMPNTTGLELHRAIRELHPGCRVIYLTGYSDFDYARTALAQQAFAYILKGEGDDVVTDTIEKALEKVNEESETREAETPAEGDHDDGQDRVSLLKEFIREHLNEDLSLNRLAEVCHFHPVYLSRVFKEATGMTVGDYIHQARLEKAEEMLKNSRMTVLEISREMGFATDNYFCRWFRKRTGISPHSYRESKIHGKPGEET